MYNSYIHLKKQLKSKKSHFEAEKSAKILKVQQNMREELLKKYKFRIAQRVLDLVSDPVPIFNKGQAKSQKLLGESFMRLKPKDSKARVKEAVVKHEVLDPQPLSYRQEFRPRHKDREIQFDMKFKPKDRYERLVDKWVKDKEIISSWEVDTRSLSPIRTKCKKVYYKSIETVALNVSPETCEQDKSIRLLRNISEESVNDEGFVNDQEKLGILAHSALEKCKLRPAREERFTSSRPRAFERSNH
jgi:hypothetical protein